MSLIDTGFIFRINKTYDTGLRYQSVSWTPTIVRSLELFYKNAPISMQCNKSDGSRFRVSLFRLHTRISRCGPVCVRFIISFIFLFRETGAAKPFLAYFCRTTRNTLTVTKIYHGFSSKPSSIKYLHLYSALELDCFTIALLKL